MAVVYDEGRVWSASRDGIQTVRTLRVTPYSEVSYVADLLLGGARLIGGFLFRIPPARDPFFPACICTKVEADEGIGAWTGTAASGINNLIGQPSYAEGCRIRVTYDTITSTLDPRDGDLENPPPPATLPTGNPIEPTNQQEIDLANENWDFSAQQLTHDGKHLGFVENRTADPTQVVSNVRPFVTVTVPQIQLALVRHYVIRPPYGAIQALCGCVNEFAFGKTRNNWPVETVRFDGTHTMRKLTSFGIKYWEMSYKFALMLLKAKCEDNVKRSVGWLRQYDPKTGIWRLVTAINDRQKFLYDYDTASREETLRGVLVQGFNCLFHPRAT